MTELQEALAQQTALLQMSGLGFGAAAGMFARPPHPATPMPPPPPHQPTGMKIFNCSHINFFCKKISTKIPIFYDNFLEVGAPPAAIPPYKPPVPSAEAGVWTPPTMQQVMAETTPTQAGVPGAIPSNLLPRTPLPAETNSSAGPAAPVVSSPHGFQGCSQKLFGHDSKCVSKVIESLFATGVDGNFSSR